VNFHNAEVKKKKKDENNYYYLHSIYLYVYMCAVVEITYIMFTDNRIDIYTV